MRPKAYSYVRFSTLEQAGGDSYRRQTKAAREYADAHNLELATSVEHSFFDRGRSAYTADHMGVDGQLRRFFDLVQEGEIAPGSYLLVESLDRLSRQAVEDALPRFLDLLNAGIHIATLLDGQVYAKGQDFSKLILSIVYMSRAHDESATKSGRLSRTWDNKRQLARENGKPFGNACPAWLHVVGDRWEVKPEPVQVITRIFELAASGVGATATAQQLNSDGVAPFGSAKRNKLGRWSDSSVKKLLRNRALIGEYQPTSAGSPDGPPVQDYYPVVVAPERFHIVQSLIAGRRQARSTRQTDDFNVWSGVGKCYECGASLHVYNRGSKGHLYRYLQCANVRLGVCKAKPVRLDRADTLLPELLAQVDALALVQDSKAKLTRQLQAIEGQLATVATTLTNVNDMFAEFPSKALAKQLHDAEAAQTQLTQDRAALQASLAADTITDRDSFFSRLDLVTREGRHAANVLLKRLGLFGFIQSFEPQRFQCWVVDNKLSPGGKPIPPLPFTPSIDALRFTLSWGHGAVSVQPYADSAYGQMTGQGLIHPLEAELMQLDSWDDLPPHLQEWFNATRQP